MQLTIPRSELKSAVTGLSKIVPSKPSLPILGNILFEVKGTLTATATDLIQYATFRFTRATVSEDGVFVLPLTALKELAKGSDGDQIGFTLAPGNLVTITNNVAGNVIQFCVNTLDPAGWVERFERVTHHEPAPSFLETYRRLTRFASSDETRFAINHVFIDVEGKGDRPVCMVATDGRRLSVWNSMRLDLKRSIPLQVSRFLCWNGLTGEPLIGLSKDRFGISVGPWEYCVRVPELTYPNWRQVIPDYSADTKLQRVTFSEKDVVALQKILPTFPGHDRNVAITLAGREGRVSITGRGQDAAQDTVLTLESSTYEGAGGHIGMDRSYLLDALSVGFRTFTYVDAMTPLSSKDERGGTHVLMPMRVDVPTTEEAQEPSSPATVENNVPATMAGETKKENSMNEPVVQETALDKLQAAFETTKQKIRDANSTLLDLAGLIKEVAREERQRRTEVEAVRAGLAKLQAIKV